MDSLVAGAASPTYQCVVCQSTCVTPNELHRHQSYRHTSEELSLSIIGVHNAAIRTFDLPNGIVYDNSWLYDPNRHAEFYTYSANMLCDDNNNGDVVDYAFKAFKDRVVEESGPAAVPDDEDCTHDLDRCINEKYENENFAVAQNSEQESWIGASKILDLRLKIDLEVETEIHMDTAKDHFWGCGKGPSRDVENLGRNDKKSTSSKSCVKSQNLEKLQTCVPDGLASKILDLGRKVFSENRTDTAANDFGKSYEVSLPCSYIEDSGNLGRDIDEKSKKPQIKTCEKVQNLDQPQSGIQESEILDLSKKIYSKVQPETRTDMSANNFGKHCEQLHSDVGNRKGKTAKRRSSPSKCRAKIKARKLNTPRKKLESPKQGAAKPENTENTESGNVDSVKPESQDSLSWFESEASKIKRFNDKVRQIRASQKKALNLTKGARKQVKGEGRGKVKKRTMQSCGREDFDSEDLLGFDEEGATINATSSKNAKRPRVPRKKVQICKTSVEMSASETHELPKEPLDEETAGETGITRICAEHSSTVVSDQSVLTLKSTKSKIHATTAGKAKKPRVSWKKEKIGKTEVDNFTDLLEKQCKEETAGETDITLHSAEHSSIIGSDQSLFDLESSKSKIHVTTAGKAKKPRVSWKNENISKTAVDNSAELPKEPRKEETAEETEITQKSGEHNSIIGSDQSLFDLESSKSKIPATTSRNVKEPTISKKKEKISKSEPDNSAELPKEPRKEETAGGTEITLNSGEHSSIIGSDQSLFDLESSKSKIPATTSGNVKEPTISKKKEKISESEADSCADETADLLKKLFEEETAGGTQINQNQADGTGNHAERSSIFSSDKYSPHFKRKKSKVYAITSGNAKKPGVSKKRGNISETQADNSADETAELLKLLEEETDGETQITENQDNGNGNPQITQYQDNGNGNPQITQNQDNGNRADRSSFFTSVESTFHSESKEAKIDMASLVNAKTPIASKRKAKNLETAANEPVNRESPGPITKPANQTCEKQVEDFPACLDADTPKINAMCAENDGAQADQTVADKPAKHKSIVEIENGADQNCEEEIGLQPNWNFESPDFLACPNADGQKMNAMCAENAGAQAEKIVADKPAEEESTGAIEKGANQTCAKEAGLQPNSDFESADFLTYPDGDGQKIKAMYAGNVGAQTKNVPVDVTAELLKNLLGEPSKEETSRETEKLQNRDDENGNCVEQSSIFGSAESTIHFESKEVKIAAAASGSAKTPIASRRKARNPKTVTDKGTERETTKPADQKCTKEVRPRQNWDFESADFLACSDGNGQQINTTCAKNAAVQAERTAVNVTAELLRELLTEPSEKEVAPGTEKLQNEDYENEDYNNEGSFFSSDEYLYYFPSEEAKMAAMSSGYAKKPVASRKKSNDLKNVTVWPAKQKMTRKIDPPTPIDPSTPSREKSNDLTIVNVWPAKQKMTQKIVNYGNGNSSKQSSAWSRDVFSYMGSEGEEVTITPLSKFRAERSNALGKKPINVDDENCAGHDSNFVPNIYTCTDRVTNKVETSNAFANKPKKMNAGVENCAEHNSNSVTNIYTCTDRVSRTYTAGKPKKRQVTSKKSTNSERVSDNQVVEEIARGMPKLFYKDFDSETFVSQNSPPIIDVNSSTESGTEEEMSMNSPVGNFAKSIVVRNKKKNLKTADDEPAVRGTTRTAENSENRVHDNVISIYKDSSLIPVESSATDNELPPVTFVAYPPYVDENSILVLNPVTRELVWKCLDTEDSRLDDTANFHWRDGESQQQFSETGKATTSRNVDGEKSASSVVPAVIGSSASSKESSLWKTNVVRRSTRPRKVTQRYKS